MQRHLLLLCFLICCATVNAEKTDSIYFLCKVADAFTGDYIKDGEVDILSTDSTFLCKGRWTYSDSNGKIEASLVAGKLPNNNKYILRLTHKDYVTTYHALSLRLPKRSDDIYYPTEKILMRKLPMRQKERTLGEAVVTATKIKMVMKGDTIVYNADAFQLSQGSMLDALIEQLPGAQLNEDGVITVNGKRISSLLVNGKDFFRGDPKIALENLPAYMVNKVKVYEQQTDFEKLTGVKEWERPLVMDVNLKKEYSIGWIANAEAAYGTENKYLGRVFALRFTDCSRLAFFGNINNTNDTRRAGSKGDWTPRTCRMACRQVALLAVNIIMKTVRAISNGIAILMCRTPTTIQSQVQTAKVFCPQEVLSHRAMTTHAATPLISKQHTPSLC